MSKLGCRKDKFDERDYLMRAYLPVVKLPKKIDYTSKMSPVRDQGDEGTCVGFAAVCGMKEYQEIVDYGKTVELSPRFLYAEARKIDGLPNSEEGTTLRAAVKALKKSGVCREKLWPYAPHQKNKAASGAGEDAKKFCVTAYARILNLYELRSSLVLKGPCLIGVEVFEGMMKTKTGKVPMPKRGEGAIGGHALSAVGFDDDAKLIKFKNSWSGTWGENGYGYLSYAYIEKYMMDAWSSVDFDDPNPLVLSDVLNYSDGAGAKWKR